MSVNPFSFAFYMQCGVCNFLVTFMSFTEEEEDKTSNLGTIFIICLKILIKMIKAPFY